MISFMRSALAACICSWASFVASAQHTVDLATGTAVLDEPLRAVLHLRPWNAAQLEYGVNCVQVELRYGDFVVPPGQLQWSTTPVPEAGHVRVVVSSPLTVNEPLVHLRLTLICDPQQEHQWTLLTEPALPTVRAKAQPPENVWADSVAGMVALKAFAPAFDTATPKRAALRPKAAATPKLRVDPSDTEVLMQAMRTLLQQRSPATAEAANTEALLGQLRALQEHYQQLQAGTQELRLQLERLQRPPGSPAPWTASATWVARDSLPWLGALLLAILVAWGLQRHAAGGDDSLARAGLDLGRPGSSPVPARAPRRLATLPATLVHPLAAKTSATLEPTLPDDTQSHVEHLLRDGHLDTVTWLMEKHLQTESRVSAPLLLDLLDLYREQAQAEPHARVAAELTRWFNTPDPLSGTDDGTGLQAHPATLEQITAVWNDPGAARLLTAMMLRPSACEELQLSAFRDMLHLYQLAVIRDDSGPSGWGFTA